ncbi:MAG: hypothetical protein O3A92_03425 [Verrucomicrobia bacterium]|nr:hypothetical protein [Verrucomicrobiota bacterium]
MDEIGASENTLVFYTSDNGPVVSNGGTTGGLRGATRSDLEGGRKGRCGGKGTPSASASFRFPEAVVATPRSVPQSSGGKPAVYLFRRSGQLAGSVQTSWVMVPFAPVG